ncbi:hypothetical protein [Azohydromonas aeria]|uniref:hypothetical protein n=1 Tax=Azohydromonas aeria TaxID=2590212 RepID=UPI0012F8CE56|nr:hypothetical protein [Azohydromonas aeria]
MEAIAALLALAVLAVPVATAGVGMLDQRPKAGPALMWTGIGTIVVAECAFVLMVLL